MKINDIRNKLKPLDDDSARTNPFEILGMLALITADIILGLAICFVLLIFFSSTVTMIINFFVFVLDDTLSTSLGKGVFIVFSVLFVILASGVTAGSIIERKHKKKESDGSTPAR